MTTLPPSLPPEPPTAAPTPTERAEETPQPRQTFSRIEAQLDGWIGVRVVGRMLPCLLASVLACLVVLIEQGFGHRNRQGYLVFNLFLAWLPLLWAVLAVRAAKATPYRSIQRWGCSILWLLFLPNAPYVFTDLVHLLGKSLPHYWPDMMKILLFSMAALGAGMLSLRLVHQLVEEHLGWVPGWVFVAIVSALSAVGVALGRFRRWNSWDALQNPQNILRDALDLTQIPYVTHPTGWFVAILACLIFCSYLMLRGPSSSKPGSED